MRSNERSDRPEPRLARRGSFGPDLILVALPVITAPSKIATVAAALALCALGMTGCQKTLFPSDLPRNQFETHDRMRQVYTPLEEPDVFGTPQPALRARLTQPQ